MSAKDNFQPIVVEWLTDIDEIRAMRGLWLELENRASERTIYCDHDWIMCWYEGYLNTKYSNFGKPLIGIVRKGGQLVGVAPFVTANITLAKIPVNFITFAGFNLQAGEFLIEDDHLDVAEALLSSLADRGGWDVLSIPALQPDWDLTKKLQHGIKVNNFLVKMVEDDPYAIVDLTSGYEHYLATRPSRFRTNLKRWERILTDSGGWQINKLHNPEKEAQSFLNRVLTLSLEGWRAKERGIQEELSHHPLISAIVRDFTARDMLDIQILTLDGKDVAYCMGLIEKNIYYHLLQGFDNTFRNLSPGAFLLQKVLKDLGERGIITFLSHGDYDYKKHWAGDFINQSRLVVFNRTARARLSFFASYHLKPLLLKIMRPLGSKKLPDSN